jgi:site-specific recombinase XerD
MKVLQGSRKLFVQTATNWLHFLGRLDEPQPKSALFADRLADFAAYQRDERGLSPATIRGQGWHVEKFLSSLGEQHRSFDEVRLEDVDTFLADNGKRGWGRVSVSTSARALRAFFRHAAARGWCSASIAAGIDGPRLFQHEGLPIGPSWTDVQRLLASTGGESVRDIRDRAILMLLATYRTEVVVAIVPGKLGNWKVDHFDLAPSSGETGVPAGKRRGHSRYLNRCAVAHGRVFRPQAPWLPRGAAIWLAYVCALESRSLAADHHCLRHACAGRLVAEGFSLKEIGDHLGHRSGGHRIYAKVDLIGLREVADFDLRGLR